jgi:lipopolysaccharide transport system permease protein
MAMSNILQTTSPVIKIQPSRGWTSLDLRALWEYRELLYFLAWRDIKVRYKQTVLGAAWAIIQPLTTMVILTIIFGQLAKIPSDGMPYPIFSFCALLPWNYFAGAFGRSSGSLVGSAHLISKVYFPRLVIPISSLLSGLLDFAIAFVVLIGLMFWYHIIPTVNILWLPAFLLMAVATALGVGLWLGALNVQYRDVGYLVPFLSQIWMYATPVVYSSSLIPERWRLLYGLNPMAGVVEGFRWALLGRGTGPGPMLAVSVLITVVLLISGAFYFKKMERTFADII